MSVQERTREQALESLNSTVAEAAAFFATVSPVLSDGRQTAHGVLAQMVYWHERYVEVLQAIAAGEAPNLIDGTVEMLNAAARHRYAREPMVILAHNLAVLQQQLDAHLRELPDWSVNFPVKHDSGFCNINERVCLIEQNIRNRTIAFKRAARH